MNRRSRVRQLIAALATLAAVASACGSDAADTPTSARQPTDSPTGQAAEASVTLLAYDSFVTEGTTLGEALAAFTESTGIEVEVVIGGDAGTMVSKAALTAGNPEGDVMFGIDNTLLSRAIDAEVFEPYASVQLDALHPDLVAIAPAHEVTPVDYGDVCLNYDIGWFEERELDPPATLADLTDPAYRDLLVVQNPASSSPGLAFLLASIAEFGEGGWQRWWSDLRDNGVEVVESWTDAYSDRFSGSVGRGPRPIVVSYGSSPPVEVLYADPPREDAPTAVIPATCFRQVEFAGVLRGAEHPRAARLLVDFLAGPVFQAEVPLNLFVYPARRDVALPREFTEFSTQPDDPYTIAPGEIAEHREEWVEEWTEIVLR